MNLFSDMRIAGKILLAVAALGILSLGIAGIGSLQLTRMAATTAGLVNDEAESLKIASAANERLARLHQLWLERLIETDTQNLPKLRETIRSERADLSKQMQSLKPFMDGDDVATFDTVARGIAEYDALMAPVEGYLAAGNRREAETRGQDQAGELYAKINELFNKLVDHQDSDLDAGAAEAARSSKATTWWLLAGSFAALLVVAGLTLAMVRRAITGPLAVIVERMGDLAGGRNDIEISGTERGDEIGAIAKAVLVFREAAVEKALADAEKARADAEQRIVVESLETGLGQLAQGDLTARIDAHFSPTYESVKVNFNDALNNLRTLIGSVMESTASIRTGSGEIAQASEDLARRTEANAASLEETSAAVTQMDGRLKATATAAGRTVARADGAIATVAGGRSVADEAVQAMNRVAAGAKGIDSVIEGLDKIAFQTRVLAMNAAVEAGRAGEAGRGFAVVADLVSALAMRSEEEAARARDQLTATQTDIVSAVEMVGKVDGALAEIATDVGEVHALLGNMATDNQAQSTAITQISVAVGTMDQSTQQNAAMVEQTSAAARNLLGEVTSLADQASKFVIGGEIRRPAAPAPARAPARAPKAAAKSGAKSGGYVSPVQALPVAAMASASSSDDWTSF
ncbi:methyl-accepting chemotaxis protein [Sphingomonas sp. MMS12-HWE2-04]|uniref:methyl-accepting chemotaxis protein n=1 Tax=Sphingomonas sp. MMS12-HWE2-04 TaxID=3234199 RepID=UPI00384C405D